MKKFLACLTIAFVASTANATTLGTSASSPDPVSSFNSTTGLYSAGPGSVAISTAGTEVLKIDGTKVGIGTSSPPAPFSLFTPDGEIARFQVNAGKALSMFGDANTIGFGTYTNDNLVFWTNNGLPQMTLTTTGQLSIGDPTPVAPLSVQLNGSSGDIAKFNLNGGKAINIWADSAGIGLGTETNDNLFFWTNNGVPQMILTTAGFFGIGNAAPAHLLHVGSTAIAGAIAEFQNSAGDCTFTPSAGTLGISCSSDERLKKDIVDEGSALKWLANMRVRNYTIKSTGEKQTGVIAQEMLPNHPDMVRFNDKGTYLVEQPNPWKLVKAIQEQQEQIKRNEATIAILKAKLGI